MIPVCILAIEDESDREFMTHLFLNYNRLMYSEIIRIVKKPWITEDVLQSTLERLIDKIAYLRSLDREHLVNYLISASKNTAANYLRNEARHKEYSVEDNWIDKDVPDESFSVDARILREEDAQQFAKIWPLLDERSRYILEGKYVLEKTSHALASELHMTPEAFRVALHRARKRAYALLLEYYSE